MQSSNVVEAARSRNQRQGPTRLRWRGLNLGAALLLLGAGLVGFGGCGLSTEGIPGGGCTDDLACPAPDLCKIGSCPTDGKCVFTGLPDGLPPIQVPGDCSQARCAGGEPVNKIDATDSDDGNPCTDDMCSSDGKPTHTKLDGVPCGANSVCKQGVCETSCTKATDDCTEKPVDNPCTVDSCDLVANKCTHDTEMLHGKSVGNESPDDCKETVCVHGVAKPVPNDTETGSDGEQCTADMCEGGIPKHTPLEKGAPCGGFQCDGAGKCGCKTVADCVGVDDECKQRTCTNLVCGTAFTPIYTPLVNGQNGNNCLLLVCDGAGNAVDFPDDRDTPDDDGNGCTDDVCSNGSKIHPPKGNGSTPAYGCAAEAPSSCGNDGLCDGGGGCRKYSGTSCGTPLGCSGSTLTYQDTCNGAGQCSDAGTASCAPYVCNATSCKMSCGNHNDCTNANWCNGSSCVADLGNGSGCGAPEQCLSGNCVDNTCCQQSPANCGMCKNCTSGSCQNDPAYTSDGGCGGGKKCDGGGGCKTDDGGGCTMSNTCISNNCCNGGSHNNTCQPNGGC